MYENVIMYQNLQKCTKMNENVQKCTENVQKRTKMLKCTKTYKNVQICTKTYKWIRKEINGLLFSTEKFHGAKFILEIGHILIVFWKVEADQRSLSLWYIE